jgi:hypothetical protein
MRNLDNVAEVRQILFFEFHVFGHKKPKAFLFGNDI